MSSGLLLWILVPATIRSSCDRGPLWRKYYSRPVNWLDISKRATDRQGLTEVPGNISSDCTTLHLQKLRCDVCKFGVFNDQTLCTVLFFKNLCESLDLSFNSITHLPSGVFSNLTQFIELNLTELDLGFNWISEIDKNAFHGLSSLQTLVLFKNQMSTISNGTFTGLNNLQKLNLELNNLTQISAATFTGLTNLQILSLSYNQISQID